MFQQFRSLVLVSAVWLPVCFQASHAADLSDQPPVSITMQLGTAAGEDRFVPDTLSLKAGTLYVLRLENPGKKSYYFSSPKLADAIYTRKVVALDANGNPSAEVYGAIRRVEVKPGQVLEWWFIPIRTGLFDDVVSRKSEAAAGMKARIEVQ